MKYILVLANNTFSIPMYKDLWKREDVFLYIVNKTLAKPVSFLRKIHTDPRCNQIVNLPCRDIWERDLLNYAGEDVCYLFSSEAIVYLSEDLLLRIKNHSQRLKMVLLLVDSLHANSIHLQWARPMITKFPWDLVITYDKDDAEEFDFSYMGCNIYSFDMDCKPSNNQSDIYFVGTEKAGRNRYVSELYNYFSVNNVNCNFHLMDRKYYAYKYIGKSKSGLEYHLFSRIKYEEILADVLASNCVLEIVQKGQKAQTARYYEAVCANKKLLTNNHYIKELPFYNERYMKVFDDFGDIDIEWIKRKEKIDYGYNGEFSPVRILGIIENILER